MFKIDQIQNKADLNESENEILETIISIITKQYDRRRLLATF